MVIGRITELELVKRQNCRNGRTVLNHLFFFFGSVTLIFCGSVFVHVSLGLSMHGNTTHIQYVFSGFRMWNLTGVNFNGILMVQCRVLSCSVVSCRVVYVDRKIDR